jgi:exo-beta-1,3-glucanase (GH17 family)
MKTSTLMAILRGIGAVGVRTAIFVLTLALCLLSGCGRNKAEPSPARGSEKTDRLKKVFKDVHFAAYTPLSYNPLPGHKHAATSNGIREDLQLLRTNGLDGVVTYSCDQDDGLDQIVPIAAEMRMTVILGIWDIKSVREIATAVDLATRFTNVVGVLVGNETLLRGGSFEDLEAAMKLVKAALPSLPVSTSEPIASYGNEDLRIMSDFYALNVHWIFQGCRIDDYKAAVDWLIERCKSLRLLRYGDRPILVKEHGYPSGGDPRFTTDLQREYWYYLIKSFPSSESNAVAVFEAFSLDWKSSAANPKDKFIKSEQYWGFWDDARNSKPVVEALKAWK